MQILPYSKEDIVRARKIRHKAPEKASEPPALAAVQLNQRPSHMQHLGVRGKEGLDMTEKTVEL